MNRRSFDRGGVALSWTEGAGRHPVLFQHGLCGDAMQTTEVFPADGAWRLMTLECRGHGLSQAGPTTAFSIATFTDDVAAFIEDRGHGALPVGGISMGAAIVLRLAVIRPDLVSALILVRPAWLTAAAPPNMLPNAAVGALLRNYAPAEARARFEAGDLAKGLLVEATDNLASLRSFFSREPTAITAELLCRIAADGPGVTAADLDRLALPTLVVGTARDAVHPLALARQLAAMIPGASFIEITPKATSRDAYAADLRSAIANFLEERC